MRIGLVLPAVPAYSETFFRNKIAFLKATPGFEVVVFADRKSGDNIDFCDVHYAAQISSNAALAILQSIGWVFVLFVQSPVKVIRLWRVNANAGFGFRKNMTSLIKSGHILKQKIDWLHFGFGTMALGREHVARVIGSKMAVSFRGFDIAIYPLKNKNCYSLLWKMVDSVHVISDDLAQLVHNQGYPIQKLMVKITPAIDVNKFVCQPRGDMKAPIQFITIARLHWKKGLEYTLQAMALMRSRGIDFRYTIIGDGEEKERLMFAVNQLDLNDHVIFTGRLEQKKIIERLLTAEIYIQYSIQEGFCNAVLEAQAMGLLCIVSDAEGLAENVLHEKTGWVVPKRKPHLLASKIEEVLKLNTDKVKSIRDYAAQRVVDEFNVNKQHAEFVSFYTKMANPHENHPVGSCKSNVQTNI
jgi:glycosyltransferase involved in cell wall biosynthesis